MSDTPFTVRLLSLRLALKALIMPCHQRTAAVIPMSAEPEEVTALLDSFVHVGVIRYEFKAKLYVWYWLGHGFDNQDELIDKVVDLLISKYHNSILLYESIYDEE